MDLRLLNIAHMILSIALVAITIGTFCAALYRFAVHALSLLVAVAIGTGLYDLTAQIVDSIIGGAVAGLIAMLAGSLLFSTSHSKLLRFILICGYSLPAGYAGYRISLSMLQLGPIEGFWLHAVAFLAAITTGLTAAIGLATPLAQRDSPA